MSKIAVFHASFSYVVSLHTLLHTKQREIFLGVGKLYLRGNVALNHPRSNVNTLLEQN